MFSSHKNRQQQCRMFQSIDLHLLNEEKVHTTKLIEWEWLIRGMKKLKWGKRQVFNPSVGAKSALRQGHRFEFLLVFFIQMASLQLVHVILIQWSLFLPSPPFVLSHACTATLFFQYSSLYCICVLQYPFPQWPASLFNRDWITILPWSLIHNLLLVHYWCGNLHVHQKLSEGASKLENNLNPNFLHAF